jgi:hypothetical protein
MVRRQNESRRARSDVGSRQGKPPLWGNLVKPFTEGVKLSAGVFFDVIAHAPCPNKGYPCGIVFIHRCEKCIYDSHFFGSAERPQVDSQEEAGTSPKSASPVSVTTSEKTRSLSASYCVSSPRTSSKILLSPLWIIHKSLRIKFEWHECEQGPKKKRQPWKE